MPRGLVGAKVAKPFSDKVHEGTVIRYRPGIGGGEQDYHTVLYTDGDMEDLDDGEITPLLISLRTKYKR